MKIMKNNDIRSIQQRYGIVLVILVTVVALMTSMLLGKKAETLTYPLNCVMEEHVHNEDCYEYNTLLSCEEDHEHEEACSEVLKQLVCETVCHKHIAGCFQKDVPDGIRDVEGIVIAYEKTNVLAVAKDKQDTDASEMEEEIIDSKDLSGEPKLQDPVKVEEIPFTTEGEQTGIVDMSDYEYLAELSYYDSENEAWVKITEGVIVPMDAKVRLNYNFIQLDINVLKASGGKAFYKMPDPLRNNIADGKLEDNLGNQIATAVRGENNTVEFTFDSQWIEDMIAQGASTLAGSFELMVDIDPKVVGEDSQFEIQFEKSRLNVTFDEDWQSKRALLDVEKSDAKVVETEDGAFFEYTISVTASSDGVDVSDVKVCDLFTANRLMQSRQYIDSYVGVTATKTPLDSTSAAIAPVETKPVGTTSGSVYLGAIMASDEVPAVGSYVEGQKPGTLVWDIGDMEAGETRTLTYRAKIKENFTHTNVIKENNGKINNQVEVYSKEYLRNSDETTYITNNKFTSGCHHKSNQVFMDDNGDAIVRFKILLEPSPNNDFSYQDLRIRDELFPTHGAAALTDVKYKPYLTFVEDSFRLYSGNVNISAYDSAEQLPIEDGALTIDDVTKMFELNLGTMEPGECISLIYDVKVDKGAFTLDSKDFTIANTFITLNGTDTDAGKRLDRFSNVATIDGKIWSRKTADETVTEDITSITIPSTDAVYDSVGNLATETVEGFNVPAGAYRYFIILNEDGKWDFSKATLTDQLSEYLRYSGYVKINAYEVSNTSFDAEASTNPNVVEEFLKTQPLIKTSWLKINDLQSFTLTPAEVGIEGRYAYTLEYYALPHNVEDVSTISVSNTFTIQGDVGDGVYVNESGAISVEKYVTVTGGESFGVKKQGWMFEKTVENDPNGNWTNGRLTWVIEVDANLKENFEIRDLVPTDQQWYYFHSLLGVYVGNLEFGKTWSDYANIEDFEANANVRKLNGVQSGGTITDEVDYSYNLLSGVDFRLKFEKDIPKETGEYLYFMLSSTPLDIHTPDYSKLDIKTFTNAVYTRQSEDEGWVQATEASYNVSSKGPVYKVFDGVGMTNSNGYIPIGEEGTYKFDEVLKDYVSDSGVYSEWYVNLNWNGEVSGLVEMSDVLPEGMELAYVRMFEIGPDYDSVGLSLEKPITPDIPELETSDWVKKSVTATEYNGTNELSCTYYYNPKTREVRWNVDNLYPEGTKNSRNVQFQVIAKIVSQDILLSSEEIEFANTIKVTDENGKETSDTAVGSVVRESLSKDTTDDYQQDAASYGSKIPFVVEVNSYGVDMNPDGDKLVVIDEPGQYLRFDTESIKIYELIQPAKFKNVANQAQISATGNKVHPSDGAAKLVDGSKTSLFKFYNAALTSEQSVFLEYDEPKLMNSFVITFERAGTSDSNNYHYTYSILAQNSQETTTWDTIADHVVANRTSDYEQAYAFDEKMYDTIKIVMHSCKIGAALTDNGWPAIAEFAVYGQVEEESDVLENVKENITNLKKRELDISEWNAALEVTEEGLEILKLTIPDDKWLQLEYLMEYHGPKGAVVSITNNVRWDGMPNNSGSNYENDSFQYDVMGTIIPNAYANLEVFKVDENNLRKYLKGAEFDVIKCQVEADGSITELSDQVKHIVTNDDGFATTYSVGDGLDFNTVYCLKETKAPTGYVINSEPMYFAVAKQININGSMAYPQFPDNVYVHTQTATYTYTCLNGKGKIELSKKFLASEGNETQLQDGTYQFGLFKEENPQGSPIHKLAITIKNGNATYKVDGVGSKMPYFIDIDVNTGERYYIYELDEQDKPVLDGSHVIVDEANYVVHYPDNNPIVVDGTSIPVKEVHNYLTYRLPESGGIGTHLHMLLGFAAILLSFVLYLKRQLLKKGEL